MGPFFCRKNIFVEKHHQGINFTKRFDMKWYCTICLKSDILKYMHLWINVEQFWISVQILSLTSVTLCCNQSSFSPTNVMHFHTYILTRRDKKESKDFQSRQKNHLALGSLAKLGLWSILAFWNWSFVKLLSFLLCQFLWQEVFLRNQRKHFPHIPGLVFWKIY